MGLPEESEFTQTAQSDEPVTEDAPYVIEESYTIDNSTYAFEVVDLPMEQAYCIEEVTVDDSPITIVEDSYTIEEMPYVEADYQILVTDYHDEDSNAAKPARNLEMTTEDKEKFDTMRRQMAESHADSLLNGLPETWRRKLEAKVVSLLLAGQEGFDVEAATAFLTEKCDEWSSLPSQKRYKHLCSQPLEADSAA